ncbi:protein ENHANCED DOWNY MILDEW 2 isoform X2 [Oryza sativa Japonica Group]|uniref:protein ENHANCED DOWNY MILDEW 2 isoform X2 n=1 Tax=Oryza sativa subsp. japonica TaxID=39947 RepID=UPI00339D2028
MALFDDDDDEFPQLKDVDQYACKDSHEDLVCFSILPFWFDEEHRLLGSEKGVYIRGIDCEGRQPVYKRIEAWRVELDCEKPMISVLSSEGNWIRLLNPHPGYAEDIARSVLITIQMIHFVRKHPAKDERTLSKHLCEVFRKFFTKPPEVDDLRKSYSLIKYFMKMDQTLVKSKILRRPLEDTWIIIETELRKASPNESFIVSNESSTNCDDYTEDGSSGSSDDNGDNYTDGNASDDGTEAVCAICDQGGILLGCKGECKRSFHPKLEDGTKSFCKTLGYTSREVEEIPIFICSNCQHKQHQCFKCGQLDSSHETNPKVFQCCNASCGRFYHPKCVAGLLEPDGACGLEKRIADGMTFTCPVHWCFECKQIEDRSQTQLWLAVCRRCVRSYHKKCLPREISFKKKDVTARVWEVPKGDPKIFIYCLDHDIDATFRTPCRDHIKFPSAPQIERVKDLARKKVKVTDIRNTDEVSPESAELSTKPSREEGDQSQEVPISREEGDQSQEVPFSNKQMDHNLLEHECATNNLRVDLQYESPIVRAAASVLISSEAAKLQENQLGSSILMEKTSKSSPCPVNSGAEKRLVSIAGKGGSLGTYEDIVIQFLARSVEIYFELASQLEELKQEQDSLISTRVPSLEMGMAFQRAEKLPSLIVEKETKMAIESNVFKQMEQNRELSSPHKRPKGGVYLSDEQIKLVEYESTLELIQSKIREVKRLKTEVIDFVEIEELSSFHRKATAEVLITKMQSDMSLVWGKLSQHLDGLDEEAMLDREMHSLVQKCYFVADHANELVPCLPETST